MFAGKGPDVMLARQTLLNCGAFHGFGSGCDGGDPIDVCECLSPASFYVASTFGRFSTVVCMGIRTLPGLAHPPHIVAVCSPLYG
jgi:hypothetical protein